MKGCRMLMVGKDVGRPVWVCETCGWWRRSRNTVRVLEVGNVLEMGPDVPCRVADRGELEDDADWAVYR